MTKPITITLLALAIVFAFACTQSPPNTPTPDIDATIQAAVIASIPTPTPEPTPDVGATVAAAIEATKDAAEPTPANTPQPTPTKTTIPTPTNTPEPTPTVLPTEKPTPTATPTLTPFPTPSGNTFTDTRTFYGPESGELVQDAEGLAEIVSAVDIADFMIEFAVTIPEHISGDLWVACITTRGIAPEAYERGEPLRGHHVCLNQHAAWFHLVTREGSEESDLLYQSRTDHIRTAPGQTNHVRLVATDSIGLLFINDEYIKELDFSGVLQQGAIGLNILSDIGTAPTRYESFKITPLRHVFGPAGGKIDHQMASTGSVDEYLTFPTLSNGVIEARFDNPYSASDGYWSGGFLFRNDAFDSFHVVVISSSGYWYHGLREGDPDNEQSVVERASGLISTTFPGTNTLRVVMSDGDGFLFINNEFVQKLDLSGLLAPGSVSALASYYIDDGIPGKSTTFSDFTIWSARHPDGMEFDVVLPTPTPVIEEIVNPEQPGSPSGERKDAQGILFDPGDVEREDMLILFHGGSEGRYIDHELWNPYAIGAHGQRGANLIFEPLAFYSAFADEEIMWLAESYSYNDDFTELTINCRQGISWSDGEDFDCEDVVYTLNTLKELKHQVRWGRDVDAAMDNAELVDKYTAKVSLLRPDPRFFFLLTYKFDIGVYIVPEHHYKGRDWTTFGDYDLLKGWPLSTGPWQVRTTSEQKLFDRRDSWWGEGVADLGDYGRLPRVKRIIYIPGVTQDQRAHALIANEIDVAAMTTPSLIAETLAQNDFLITHSGREEPYGYVDWWPVSIAFNTSGSHGPYDDSRVRWAISFYLDREELRSVAYDGASSLNPLTMPRYPALRNYFDIANEVMEEIGRSTLEYSPNRGDELLKDAGFAKNADGYWEDSGKTIDCEIIGFGAWVDLGPAVAQQLNNHGINASYTQPADAPTRMVNGDFECLMFGHPGSIRDPYYTMKLYQTTSVTIPGGYQVNFYHWENAQWDELTDKVSRTHPSDTVKMHELWRQAVRIWLEELPDVPLLDFHHRIVLNTRRWVGWPQGDASQGSITTTGYVNEAWWHLTWPLVVHKLEKR
ncbi:MAG: ABC transporter substrate-binding protein [Pseudomonadales bacterium]|nr:ABC transporter substrate-binding protein [Pseudomonadales bacterium]